MTNEKRLKVEQFISDYTKLRKQENELLSIQKGLEEKKGVRLNAELTVYGENYSLHKLSGESQESIFQSFEEDLSLYILYLINVNQAKIDNLIHTFSLTNERESSPKKQVEKNIETKTNDEPVIPPTQAMDIVIKIEETENGKIISASDLYDSLEETLRDSIILSDIHVILRDYVDQGKMQIIHNATCFKCNGGYEQDYEKLPRDVTCGHCGEDIVNIEIRYKQLYQEEKYAIQT